MLKLTGENPAFNLHVITVKDGSSIIKIVPYHLVPEGTHKMVTYYGMFQTIPKGAEELVEASTGNSAIAASIYAKKLGIPITIFMPEGMSDMKKRKLKELGVNLIETPRVDYTIGAKKAAREYSMRNKKRYFLSQTDNPGNYLAHKEVAVKLKNTDQFVCIGGTFGTIRGYADYLKTIKGESYIVTEIDLDAAPHIYNKKFGIETIWKEHGIVGAAPSARPPHADHTNLDYVALVLAEECEILFKETLRCNLNIGKSSAVNLAVAKRIAEKNPRKIIGTVTFDYIDRYDIADDLRGYNFQIANILKFFRSEVVKNLKIAVESLK